MEARRNDRELSKARPMHALPNTRHMAGWQDGSPSHGKTHGRTARHHVAGWQDRTARHNDWACMATRTQRTDPLPGRVVQVDMPRTSARSSRKSAGHWATTQDISHSAWLGHSPRQPTWHRLSAYACSTCTHTRLFVQERGCLAAHVAPHRTFSVKSIVKRPREL